MVNLTETYKGFSYNPKVRYFGPQGSWLCKIIPAYPPGLKGLEDRWNYIAFIHDVDYSTNKKISWFTRLLWLVIGNSGKDDADSRFYSGMCAEINKSIIADEISVISREYAYEYAMLSYEAVRKSGALFYKKRKFAVDTNK